MQNKFRGALFGYHKKQVDEFVERVQQEREEMALLKDRFVAMRDENNFLKAERAGYMSREQEVSDSIITAHVAASSVRREGEKSAANERARLMEELRQLERTMKAFYDSVEYKHDTALDYVRSFERDLNDLLQHKEAFLKASYEFEKTDREGGEEWTIKV